MNAKLQKKSVIVLRQLICVFILQILTMPLLFAGSSGQRIDQVRISINVENASLKEVFAVIRQQTEFVFSYPDNVLENNERYTLHYEDVSVADVLQELARKGGYRYNQINNNISVIKSPDTRTESGKNLNPPNRTIKGKVTDALSGEPLVGATIVIGQHPGIGTVTDLKGNFSISVSDDVQTLVFSYIGYLSREVDIADQTELNISLKPDSEALDEVVVVGYGKKSGKTISGSITSLSPKDFNKGPVTNIQ